MQMMNEMKMDYGTWMTKSINSFSLLSSIALSGNATKKIIDKISGQSESHQVRRTLRVYIYAFLSLFVDGVFLFFSNEISIKECSRKKKRFD
jgi:hypothetical protein